MYVVIDDRDEGEVHDNVRVVIGEGSNEISVFITRLSVTVQTHKRYERYELIQDDE